MVLNSSKYKELIKNMPFGYAYHEVRYDEDDNPADYIFLEANKKFEEITGLNRQNILGKKISDVINNIADNSSLWVKFYEEIIRSEDSKSFQQYCEKLEQWFNIKVYDEKEGYFAVILSDIESDFIENISESKKYEKNLLYSRERYETIFNSAPIGIIIEDNKGNIVEVNEVVCEMTGYNKDELEGSNVVDKLVLPEHRENAKENIKKIIEDKDLEFDIKTLTKEGKIKNSHLKETKITLPDGSKGIMSMYLDITERVKRRRELEMLDFSINKANLLIFRITPEGIIEYANETALDKLGYEKEELIGIKAKKIIKNEDYIVRDNYWKDIKSSGSIKYEIRFKPKNKKAFPAEVNSQYFKYNNQEYEFSFAQDITKRKAKEKEIQYLLYKDTLTGLYNRRFLNEQMNRLDTNRQLPISIIMADVNGLKIINDSYGHKKGDELLVKTAEILKNVLRKEDIITRFGGDEFAILLPKTSSEKAEKIIDRIKERIEIAKVNSIPISIGIGIATKKKEVEDIEETLKKADNDMYKNKLSGSKNAKNKIIQNLIDSLAAKSSETKEHRIRMDNLAHKFGKKIKLSDSELSRLSSLVTLHDIGETTIDSDILNKPEKLTEIEWEKIKEHPKIGYKIAAASDEFALVAEEILCHHEYWDGNGYPRGLKKENIPYLARIISIIDAYEVMTNERPYSKAISKEEALSEIKCCVGSQFDPKLAEKFIKFQK